MCQMTVFLSIKNASRFVTWVFFISMSLRAQVPPDATVASVPAYQTNLVYDSDGVLGIRDVKVLKHLTLFGKGQLLQLTNPIAVTHNGEVLRSLVGQFYFLSCHYPTDLKFILTLLLFFVFLYNILYLKF